MGSWAQVVSEMTPALGNGTHDQVRRQYVQALSNKTGRNVIAYYSGWLQRGGLPDTIINDKDKNGLMACIHKMDRTKGLDLILHTPGGDLAATESIVYYLHAMFGNDIRAIIPQISMSAGTMIALSCKEIMMGKHSNLGPIDPQTGGIPCQGVLDEFEKAKSDIKANPHSAPLWQAIVSRYHPTLLGSCKKAIEWSEVLAEEWLSRNMCGGDKAKAKKILKEISDHQTHKSHSRHISNERCKEIGLTIKDMEDDQDLQDKILTVHHAYIFTFTHTTAAKIIENQIGAAYVENMPAPQQMMMPAFIQPQQPGHLQPGPRKVVPGPGQPQNIIES